MEVKSGRMFGWLLGLVVLVEMVGIVVVSLFCYNCSLWLIFFSLVKNIPCNFSDETKFFSCKESLGATRPLHIILSVRPYIRLRPSVRSFVKTVGGISEHWY